MSNKHYQILIKPEAFDSICAVHGWTRSELSQMSSALGYSRQYVHQFYHGKDSLSPDAIGKIVRGLCAIPPGETWSHLFEIKEVMDAAFQRKNMAKYYGQVPYDKRSTSYEFRKQDNEFLEKIT